MRFKSPAFDSRQRANSDSKAVRKPPEKPPPYIPKKKQQSLGILESKTPPAKRSSHPLSTESISLLRSSNAYTPDPSSSRSNVISNCIQDSEAIRIDMFKVTRQSVTEKDDVRHDYEDIEDYFNRFDSSSSLEHVEPEKNLPVITRSSSPPPVLPPRATPPVLPPQSTPPVLPPRSTPPVHTKKHRLLTSPKCTEKNTLKVEEQYTGDYEPIDDKPYESDCESDG